LSIEQLQLDFNTGLNCAIAKFHLFLYGHAIISIICFAEF